MSFNRNKTMKQKLSTRELIEELQARGFSVYPLDTAPITEKFKQNLTQTYAKYQMAIANGQPKNTVTKTDPRVLP